MKNEDLARGPWGHNPAKNNAPVYHPLKCETCGADAGYAAGSPLRWMCSMHFQAQDSWRIRE